MNHSYQVDVLVVGGGLAGLVAAQKAVDRRRSVMILDQEGEKSLGGQAFWSLGGLCMIDTPEQRRMKIHDSKELATQDGMGLLNLIARKMPIPEPSPTLILTLPQAKCALGFTVSVCVGFP